MRLTPGLRRTTNGACATSAVALALLLTAAAQTHGLAHGQKVNIGSLTQLVLEGAPSAEIRDFVVSATRAGLSNTLTELGLQVDHAADLLHRREQLAVPSFRLAAGGNPARVAVAPATIVEQHDEIAGTGEHDRVGPQPLVFGRRRGGRLGPG